MINTSFQYWQLSYWSSTWRELPRRQKQWFSAMVLVHFLLSVWFIFQQGITFDESTYFNYARLWLRGHAERTNPYFDSKTPMVGMALVPALFKSFLPDSLLKNYGVFYIIAGRPFMYIYQLLGIYIVFCWLKQFWSGYKWVVPLLFFCQW